jgi:hypothetical protein
MPAITFPSQHFNANTYTGNGGTKDVTVGFDPGLVWYKNRGRASTYHYMFDTVRGANKALYPNLTDAEDNNFPAYNTQSFISNGSRIVQNNGGADHLNYSNDTYILWAWKAGSTVTNTAGTISSQVSANPTAGFSVVTYTGNGTNGATVGHGLGVVPSMIITKKRNAVGTDYGWSTYHISNGTANMWLEKTDAKNPGNWNTAPTSSVFTPADKDYNNVSTATYVNYCWAEIAGYSKFGSYTGNSSDNGPFIYTGFRPKFVMIKVTSTTNGWIIIDAARNAFNVAKLNVNASDSAAENTASTGAWLDFTSNGFKIRNGSDSAINTGQTYIYACFAESPFKYASAR